MKDIIGKSSGVSKDTIRSNYESATDSGGDSCW